MTSTVPPMRPGGSGARHGLWRVARDALGPVVRRRLGPGPAEQSCPVGTVAGVSIGAPTEPPCGFPARSRRPGSGARFAGGGGHSKSGEAPRADRGRYRPQLRAVSRGAARASRRGRCGADGRALRGTRRYQPRADGARALPHARNRHRRRRPRSAICLAVAGSSACSIRDASPLRLHDLTRRPAFGRRSRRTIRRCTPSSASRFCCAASPTATSTSTEKAGGGDFTESDEEVVRCSRAGCGRDRERPALRGRDALVAPARVAERDRQRARGRDRVCPVCSTSSRASARAAERAARRVAPPGRHGRAPLAVAVARAAASSSASHADAARSAAACSTAGAASSSTRCSTIPR